MSQPTAGKIIDELSSAGVVEELSSLNGVPRGRPSVGRPGKQLRLSQSPARLVIAELGVERTRLAAVPAALPDEEHWDVEFKTPSTEAAWRQRLRQHSAALSIRRPWGVMVSVPGLVDEAAGKMLLCPNLHWCERADLIGAFQEMFRAPVRLIQENRALALAEVGTRASNDFVLVDVGVGVGGAIVVGQRPYDGNVPVTGEIGHTPVAGNPRQCGCGNRGCLETLIAEPWLVRSLAEATGDSSVTFSDVCRAAQAADELPAFVLEALDAVAGTVAGILNVCGLKRVVLSGLIRELGSRATDHLIATIRRTTMWSRFDTVEIELVQRRRARGLIIAGIQRVIMPTDWAEKP